MTAGGGPTSRWATPTSVGAFVGLLAGLAVLGPALAPGLLLHYDLVSVPHLGLGARTLGIDGSVPRAVPGDLVVALLTTVLPGWVVQKALLLGAFALAGGGVGGLLTTRLGAAAAALAAAWNPWVAERLAIGHLYFVLGYALLPWVLRAALRARDGSPRGRSMLLLALVASSLTASTSAVLAVLVAAAALLLPRPARRLAGTLALALPAVVAANAPWWWPFLTLAPASTADPAGVTAFASAADTPFGVLGSVATGGGIWNAATRFGGREQPVVAGVALLLVLAVVVVTAVRRRPPWFWPAAAAGGLGLVLAAGAALPLGGPVVTFVTTHVPGGGLLRDGQKFGAAWMVLVAPCAGIAVEELGRAARSGGATRAAAALVAGLAALWPAATLPGLALAGGGRWAAVDYPAGWLDVAARLDAGPPGAVAVLPWTLYRRFDWNADRTLLDPWQRLVARRVVVSDDLPLSGRVVRGESPTAARIREVQVTGGDLPATLTGLGVRYVVVLTDQPPGDLPVPDLAGSRVVDRAAGLVVHDLGPVDADAGRWETAAARDAGPRRAAGLVLGLLALGSAVGYSVVNLRRRAPSPPVSS